MLARGPRRHEDLHGRDPERGQTTLWYYVDSPDDLSFSQGKLIVTNKLVPFI